MPTYEYKCTRCGRLYKLFLRLSELHKRACPECGHRNSPKISGGAGFILRGDGWPGKEIKRSDKN